ncbi:MAG: hypothetical protein NC907_06140 [Candidatus Omnitrophica bacterium]|nr:hypothetical protein [Candidatus Omnitrophota bacterium]
MKKGDREGWVENVDFDGRVSGDLAPSPSNTARVGQPHRSSLAQTYTSSLHSNPRENF